MWADLSAWIITTDAEEGLNSKLRVCFPRRICIAFNKPSGSIAGSHLRIASCAINIAGQLYVLSASPEPSVDSANGLGQGDETWGSSQSAQDGIQLKIKKSLRLGQVVNHPRADKFTLIKVSGTFRPCRDQHCAECVVPINNSWATKRLGPPGHEAVQIDALKKGDMVTVEDAVSRHHIYLRYTAQKEDNEYSQRNGWFEETGLPARLYRTDSGSLISSHGQDIGISVRIVPGCRMVKVLLFDDKLLAYLTNLLDRGKTQSGIEAPNTWKHLEIRN
ncbi:hypothetical protein FHL15_004727 [Xylaria flabelliformis]|uniref:Uncharacterized protein n=1 Tax=Xylaria flabelliformis TaxID=2512241 RepID=A0A553I229_9PEZI|nr:hypothetical protein FHL15_004727 [Xylaria flabelliformis]